MPDGRQLFRQEALDHHTQYRQWGDVATLEPMRLKVMVWFIVLSVGALVAFLFVGHYARKETAVGYLTPASGTSKIFVPRPGYIRNVHVQEGDLVDEGSLLLTVESDQMAADGVDVNVAMIDSLGEQKRRIEETIRSEEARTHSERDRLSAIIKGLEAEIGQLAAQTKIQNERLNVLGSEVEAGEQLRKKGFLTAPELRRRQLMQMEQKQAISQVAQQMSAKRNQITQAKAELQQLPTIIAQKIQQLRNDLAAVDQRSAEVRGRQSLVIRAPVAGRVTVLQARIGQTADPQRLQLEIIPDGSELQAELYLPARAIGFVEEGQEVRLLYEAFPYQHFGAHLGRVVRVSRTILTGANVGGPIKLNEPAYRVIASLDDPNINAFGKKVALQPDMLLRADIILERRSLISWMTAPLRAVRM